MRYAETLPELPDIRLRLVEDLGTVGKPGFLWLCRHRLVADYPDGTTSGVFVYETVARRALDAVVIAAHFLVDGEPHVYLRSALRPPLGAGSSYREASTLWELPAGLIEVDGEHGAEAPQETARRELAEELGFTVPLEHLRELGASAFSTPGIIAERFYAFEVAVTPTERSEPPCDGSPLEAFGLVASLPLRAALGLCERGELGDAKTELVLRRLADRLTPRSA